MYNLPQIMDFSSSPRETQTPGGLAIERPSAMRCEDGSGKKVLSQKSMLQQNEQQELSVPGLALKGQHKLPVQLHSSTSLLCVGG